MKLRGISHKRVISHKSSLNRLRQNISPNNNLENLNQIENQALHYKNNGKERLGTKFSTQNSNFHDMSK